MHGETVKNVYVNFKALKKTYTKLIFLLLTKSDTLKCNYFYSKLFGMFD